MSVFDTLLKPFQSRRSLETQPEPVNPCPVDPQEQPPMPKALSDYLGNEGKVDAMSLSTFFAAVNIISNSIAMMSWKFKDNNNKELPEDHYLYHLFDDSTLSRFNIMKNVIQDMILYGNGFIYIERDRVTGQPKTLHYSPARQTGIYFNEIEHKLYYWNYLYSHESWNDGSNFLHFFMNTDDGYIGKGILKYAYNVIDIASTIQQATNSYYSTTGQMFGIITPNGELPAANGNRQKQLNDLEAKWRKVRSKANKGTVFFPSDLKYIPTSNNAKDSTLIESREYNAVEMGRFIANLSPVMLGDYRHNVYGTLAEAQKAYVLHSITPITTMAECQFNKKLIMPSKWGKEFVDLDENSILATDQEKQATTIGNLTRDGIISRNESRDVLGLPPVEGGDDLIIPYSKIEDNKIGDTKTTEEKDDERQ